VQAKGARVRLDWLHTLSTHLADDDAAFCLEDLKIAHMTASAKGIEEDTWPPSAPEIGAEPVDSGSRVGAVGPLVGR